MAHGTMAESQIKHLSGGTPFRRAHRTTVNWWAQYLGVRHFFLLHSLTACLSEIPQRFSSSSLPPEFAAGRCATTFIPAAAAA